MKSLALAPLNLRFSPRLSKNDFDIIEDLFSPNYLAFKEAKLMVSSNHEKATVYFIITCNFF